MYVSKINNLGDVLWQKFYDYPKEDGALIWKKQIGGIEDDVFSASVESKDGKIYSIGKTENYGAKNMDVFHFATEPNGEPINAFHFGTDDYDYATSIVLTKNEDLIISAIAVGSPTTETDATVYKCDKNGTIIWQKRFSNPGKDAAQNIIQIDNEKILILGKKQVSPNKVSAWICCLDKDGNILWEKTFGESYNSEFFTGFYSNKNYNICIGSKPTPSDSLGDFWICIVNQDGELVKESSQGSNNYDIPSTAIISADNYLIIAGIQRFLTTDSLSFIVKTNLEGTLQNFISSVQNKFNVFPNPMSEFCTFLTPHDYSDKTIFIYNAAGKSIMQKTYSTDKVFVHNKDLPTGIYLFKLTSIKNEIIGQGRIIMN